MTIYVQYTYNKPWLLSQFEPVCCSMSDSKCCFLTCIQVSQKRGKVVWYSQISKNFPQFVVIYTAKASLINEAEVDVFLAFSCFFYDATDIGNLISAPLTFLNPAWTSGSSQFMYCWSLAWRILSITLLTCDVSTIVQQFEHSLPLPFFGIEIKTDPFPVLWPLLSFPNLLVYWVQHFNCIVF